MHTCKDIIAEKLQFFSAVITSVIDNQTLMITLKSQFKKKIEYY